MHSQLKNSSLKLILHQSPEDIFHSFLLYIVSIFEFLIELQIYQKISIKISFFKKVNRPIVLFSPDVCSPSFLLSNSYASSCCAVLFTSSRPHSFLFSCLANPKQSNLSKCLFSQRPNQLKNQAPII